ncbi:ATP-dependent protease ATPase subunit HslU [Aureliella helgolandensis]|uniref:ATP-dependent protease ATPase subunit HslU n=1 Tax=Aureliella helgolandensis TaxID=2527968 RepID=A0A518G990_9BACT|nr:ATP-dependent protease ATPase subunit HslU [Aureliella helgolandensis]QDV25165.1 ATP-dependent protease ATPase subunit HslU [Aureliella helgolandensis]
MTNSTSTLDSANHPTAYSNRSLTPREIVTELDRYIVGQADAKRAIAIAVRNRWRRGQLPEEMQADIAPKNILMAGPTGVGKTEIARRLAKLTNAPFIKVEATKYTEVGYYGRDVESMVRDLVENAITLVRSLEQERVRTEAEERTEDRLLDLLVPTARQTEIDQLEEPSDADAAARRKRTRDKMREMLQAGELEEKVVEFSVEQKTSPIMVGGVGVESMDIDLQGMFERIIPKNSKRRSMKIAQARKILINQEADKLIDDDKIASLAIDASERNGIIFIDEIDKVIASEGGKSADVSRMGVQRDLLPIVEGTTVNTKHGYIKTDHILFIAAGAFQRGQPSDLMPELQGRFPIRVELSDLTKEHFVRILTEPNNSLTKQYISLLATEGVTLEFTEDGIERLADFGFSTNQSTQNIGARRLYTILEKVLEDLNFDASEATLSHVQIDASYVNAKLQEICADEDLSRFIL